MCGIFGIISDDINKNKFQISLEQLNHRGPDAINSVFFKNFALGHTRLSIQDLSEKGNQPMHDEISDAWISYNGEIYNHKILRNDLLSKGIKFNSTSDTEVILKSYRLYGIEKTLQSIRGMFSFVIADKKLNKFFLVKDKFGMKPLFYSVLSNEEFIFSSEIKPILFYKDYKKINLKNMMLPLMMGLNAPGKTMFDNIHEVGAGELIYLRGNDLKIEKKTYFSCRDLVDKKYYNFLNSLPQNKLL